MQSRVDSAEPSGKNSPGLPMAALAATFGLIAAASFLPGQRLWGVNHLAFVPAYVRAIAIAAMAAAFIPPVARRVHGCLAGAAERLAAGAGLRNLTALAAAAISGAAFWVFRSSTLLLGDARLVASNFEHAFDPDYALIVSSPRVIILHEPIAKGTALLYHYVARISLEVFNAQAIDGIRFLNCALGAVLVFVLLRAVLSRQIPATVRVWAVFMVLTSGAMELFFGYVENYTPLIFFGSLYILYATCYMRTGDASRLPAILVCLLLTVFMHVQGILLVPSYVLLLLLHHRAQLRVAPVYLAVMLLAATAAGTYLFAVLTDYGKHFLAILSDGQIFGILTPSHLVDIANEILLLMPVVLVAASLARAGGRREEPGEGTKPLRLFLLLVLLPCLLFLFVFKPDLGMARDWDLFAITALGLLPLGVLAAERGLGGGRYRRAELLTAPAAVMSTVLVLSWIGVNADPGRSARRFEAVLEYDRTRPAYAYEVLSQHYRDRGDLERAVAVIEKGTSLSYNPRLMSLAAGIYAETGDTESAVRIYTEVLARKPENEGSRRNLVLLLHRLGRYEELYDIAREGTRLHPEKPVYHYFYGLALLEAGEIERGIDELLACRRLRPGSDVLASIDRALTRLEAMGYDTKARDSDTQFTIPDRK